MAEDAKTDQAPQAEPMDWATFLATHPPGSIMKVKNAFIVSRSSSDRLHLPSFRMYCGSEHCKAVMFFDPRKLDNFHPNSEAWIDYNLIFDCRNCGGSQRRIAFVISQIKGTTEGNSYKYGEHPPFGPHIPITVPLQYIWAPLEFSPAVINIKSEAILDFGRIILGQYVFTPLLYSYTNNFEGTIKANEAIRYSLQIVSDSFVSKRLTVYEVAWDGTWNENKEQMQRGLIIKEIIEPVVSSI